MPATPYRCLPGNALHSEVGVFDPATETLDRAQLRAQQLRSVQGLLDEVLPRNAFYSNKFGPRCKIDSWEHFQTLPFTTKQELAEDHIPVGTLTSTQISDVQRALFRNGFYAGAATGKWDPTSTAALEDFQKAHNLTSSGQLDKETTMELGLNPIQFGMFSTRPSETTGQAPTGASHTEHTIGK